LGIKTGVDIEKIALISRSLAEYFSEQFSGKVHHLINRKDIQIVR
jgi:hypothetical protein